MYTKTSICNMALSSIGSTEGITDFDTEHSKQAIECRKFYDMARKTALSDFPWSFAEKTEQLAILDDETALGWEYVYKFPVDCLTPLRIWQPDLPNTRRDGYTYSGTRLTQQALPEQLRVPFKRQVSNDGQTAVICTNMHGASLVYTADYENESLFSPQFINSLQLLMASYLATPIASSPTLAQNMLQAYQFSIDAAGARDLQGNHDPLWPTPEDVRVRIC